MRALRPLAGALALFAAALAPAAVTTTAVAAPTTFGYSVQEGRTGCTLVKVDLATAAVTAMGAAESPDACVRDLAVAPDGTPWGIGDTSFNNNLGGRDASAVVDSPVQLVRFSPTDGSVVSTVPVLVDGSPKVELIQGGLAVNATGVYAQLVTSSCDGGGAVCLFTVDPTTGAATEIGSSTLGETELYGLADCGGLVTVRPDETDTGYSLAPTDATTGVVGSGPAVDRWIGYDCAGSLRYALTSPPAVPGRVPSAVGLDLVTFDPATGATTLVNGIDPADADLTTFALPPATADPTTTTTSGGGNNGGGNDNAGTGAVTAQPAFTG